jgi:hypothetical protein
MDITQIEFKLPIGYTAPDQTLHREGILMLPTVEDTIKLNTDDRFQKLAACKLQVTNPVAQIEADNLMTNAMALYFSFTVSKLGDLEAIGLGVMQKLYKEDLQYLMRMKAKLERNVQAYMKEAGYPFDEYSDEEPYPPGLEAALKEKGSSAELPH